MMWIYQNEIIPPSFTGHMRKPFRCSSTRKKKDCECGRRHEYISKDPHSSLSHYSWATYETDSGIYLWRVTFEPARIQFFVNICLRFRDQFGLFTLAVKKVYTSFLRAHSRMSRGGRRGRVFRKSRDDTGKFPNLLMCKWFLPITYA